MSFAAAITSKGQITLPRIARNALKSSTVEVEVQGELVILRPVRSVAGALSGYARGSSPESLAEIREKVWEEVAHDKKG